MTDRPFELYVSGNVVDFVQSNALTFIFDGEEVAEIYSCAIPQIGSPIELTTKSGQKIYGRVDRIEWSCLESCNDLAAEVFLDRSPRPSECPLPSLRSGIEMLLCQYPPIDVVEQLSQSLNGLRDVPCEAIDLLDRAARVLEGYEEEQQIEAEALSLNRRQREWLKNRLDEEVLFFRQLDDRADEETVLMGDLERLQKNLTAEFRSSKSRPA